MAHVPAQLGPYEIVELIGKGGMGEVYRARDSRLGRHVAIKILPPEFLEDPNRKTRFEHEARAAGALNHPNIVSLYDIGRESGIPFMVSEFIDGRTLRSLIGEGPVPPKKLVEIALQAAAGLKAAHAAGIVHRDLKPENIMVTQDGRVKILDFGLARQTPQNLGTGERTQTQLSTVPGTVMGTVGYMSPEQVRGKPADARSDIFSLGAILYEMASGGRAFPGGDTIEVLSAILRDTPTKLANLPKSLDRPIRRCLEKDPSLRFQNAAELLTALEGAGAASDRHPGFRMRWLWLPAAAAVACAAWFVPRWTVPKRLPTAAAQPPASQAQETKQPVQPPVKPASSEASGDKETKTRMASPPSAPVTKPPAVNAPETIDTIAGRPWKFTGDGAPALDVTLGPLRGLAYDNAGNIYTSNLDDGLIARIDPRGVLHVLAGPDSPPRNRAYNPLGLAVDSTGALYFTEAGHLLRKFMPDGRIVTVAGGDKTGRLARRRSGSRFTPGGVHGAAIAVDGTAKFSSEGNRVRRANRGGRLETVAGKGKAGFAGDGGLAQQALLNNPQAIARDPSGNLYIADRGNRRIREVTLDGRIRTVAGAGGELRCPEGVAVNGSGELFITDPCKSQVFARHGDQFVAVGGNGTGLNEPSGLGGPAIAASFDPRALAFDPAGNLMVSSVSGQIYRISKDGRIDVIAGTGHWRWTQDGTPASQASFQMPQRMAIDRTGNIFLSDYARSRIYRIDSKRVVTQIAGSDWIGYQGEDTPARGYAVRDPNGLALSPDGSLAFTEDGGNLVREIMPDGKLRTLAGSGARGYSGDGGVAREASLANPQAVCRDEAGNLYIADTGNNRVRKVTPGRKNRHRRGQRDSGLFRRWRGGGTSFPEWSQRRGDRSRRKPLHCRFAQPSYSARVGRRDHDLRWQWNRGFFRRRRVFG